MFYHADCNILYKVFYTTFYRYILQGILYPLYTIFLIYLSYTMGYLTIYPIQDVIKYPIECHNDP